MLEPVKVYSRHAENYTSSTPLNRLVDSIPPESNAAREFRDAVDQYLARPANERNPEAIRRQLAKWGENAVVVRPMLQTNTILNEDLPVADALGTLCRVGQEALSMIPPSSTAASDYAGAKQRDAAAVQDAAKRRADILIQIAPGIQKLVDAVESQAPGAPRGAVPQSDRNAH